jgi:hypothetical protein
MNRRTTQDSPPKWAKLCPTSGTFNKMAGGTQWPGGDAWFISEDEHIEQIQKLSDRIAELEGSGCGVGRGAER